MNEHFCGCDDHCGAHDEHCNNHEGCCEHDNCYCGRERVVISLNGNNVVCNIIGAFAVSETDYIALQPIDSEDVLIYGYTEHDDGIQLENIAEGEHNRVIDAFYDLFENDDDFDFDDSDDEFDNAPNDDYDEPEDDYDEPEDDYDVLEDDCDDGL